MSKNISYKEAVKNLLSCGIPNSEIIESAQKLNIAELEKKIEELENKLCEAEAALKFYGNRDTYRTFTVRPNTKRRILLTDMLSPSWGPIVKDNNGDVARKALVKLKELK